MILQMTGTRLYRYICGTAVIDECGVCEGAGIPDGFCDCSGQTLDCAGECGGSSFTNECGDCVAEADPTCVQDCSGVWDGTAVEDEWVCDGDNSTCLDCVGTPNGAAYTNECGDCVTESDPTCIQDCSGMGWYSCRR